MQLFQLTASLLIYLGVTGAPAIRFRLRNCSQTLGDSWQIHHGVEALPNVSRRVYKPSSYDDRTTKSQRRDNMIKWYRLKSESSDVASGSLSIPRLNRDG